MTFMFELYYKAPPDPGKETELSSRVANLGGRLVFRELPDGVHRHSVCLTYEFDNLSDAEAAAEQLREHGEHVEGPVEYGVS